MTVRDDDICARYKAGETLSSIGRRYGLTRERVRQIAVRASGLTPRMPGILAAAFIKRYMDEHERKKAARRKALNRRRPAISTAIRVREEMIDRIDQVARETGMTRSAVLRQFLREPPHPPRAAKRKFAGRKRTIKVRIEPEVLERIDSDNPSESKSEIIRRYVAQGLAANQEEPT